MFHKVIYSPVTVSYTHLDVYKRQKQVYAKAKGEVYGLTTARFWKVKSCLLYTSIFSTS